MRKILIFVAILFAVSYAQLTLSCAVECAAFVTCRTRAAAKEKPGNCPYPEPCPCEKQARTDAVETDGVPTKRFRSVKKSLKRGATNAEMKSKKQRTNGRKHTINALIEELKPTTPEMREKLVQLFTKLPMEQKSGKRRKSTPDRFFANLSAILKRGIADLRNSLRNSLVRMTGRLDSEGTLTDAEAFNCGQAYERGSAIGHKMCVTIDGKPVVEATAAAFNRMKAAAAKAGVSLSLNSGFRTQEQQQYLYNCYLTKKCNNGNLAAKPGYSNHQNGKALDISVVKSVVYNWLTANASQFGFVRTVPSEKWHWELRNTRCNAFVSYSCK